jgi:hypothetical protein
VRLGLALAAALGLLMVSAAAKAAPIAQGIFGNVRDSEATGDMSGYEIRLFLQGADRMAEVTVCEGWCNSVFTAKVAQHGPALEFGFDEPELDQDYRPVGAVHNRMTLMPVPGGFRLRHWMHGQLVTPRGVLLRRKAHAYGLAVARDTQKERAR